MNDKTTPITTLQNKVSKFCEDRDWRQYHNPKDLAIMISTEASELLSIFRYKDKTDIAKIMDTKKEAVEDELADILFGLLRFAELNDIDLSQSLENKIAKNNIKYPVEKSYGKNEKYDEL
ncbi:MAG TPA: nucleotide pyrophosphohydrolase [Epulopiscium sp.]|nr:nucleotide pyrophosphohydrolase [Candidatus Epulonipiscium sp.]